MRRFLFVALSAFFMGQASLAQVKASNKLLSIRLLSEADTYYLNLSPKEGGGQNVDYRPNTQAVNGYGLSIYGLSFSVKSKVAPSAASELRYGTTQYSDTRLSFSLGGEDDFFFQGYSTKYQGLYIANTADVDPNRADKTTTIQRTDLTVATSGLAMTYIFSPKKFSLAAAINQSAIQIAPGGSFLAMLTYDSTNLSGDMAVVPSQLQSVYGEDSGFTKAKFTSAVASIGYGFTSVQQHNFYFTVMALVGAGYQQRVYGVDDSALTSSVVTTEKTTGFVSIGQNQEKVFYGVSGSLDRIFYSTGSIKVLSELAAMNIFFGLRFF